MAIVLWISVIALAVAAVFSVGFYVGARAAAHGFYQAMSKQQNVPHSVSRLRNIIREIQERNGNGAVH